MDDSLTSQVATPLTQVAETTNEFGQRALELGNKY